ncbi:MAG: hypothetical protein IJ125_07790 [Atopobiaceae bacterium]|nr:hypothetical protein [Atopobiaceae bacterium]
MMRTSKNPFKTTVSKTTAALALALMLLALPLAACSSQSTPSDGSSPASGQTQATAIDVSSWKTFGDALAYDTGENSAAGWDENHYVTVFATDNYVVRVVAKMDAQSYEKLEALDMSDDSYAEKFREVMGGLALESAEDLTADRLSQDELKAYVGKTGQDLVNSGFAFEGYWMYGGAETGVKMVKGPLAYDVTFNVSVSESDTEDGGASIMDATITDIVFGGSANEATDPTAL